MASLQDLKNNLSGKTTPTKTKDLSSIKTSNSKNKNESFELEEARYLLSLIAKTDFSGKDVQIVYNIAIKLKDIIKENLTEK